MARVFIGVGSNEGDRLEMISKAASALATHSGIQVKQIAPIAETEPIGGPPQGLYLNTVIEIETTIEPEPLLDCLQEIERSLGRLRDQARWSARPMDLDLLLYDDRVLTTHRLIIPHPSIHLRRFVMEPLAQLAADLPHPVLKDSIATLLERLPHSFVERLSGSC